MNSTHTDPLLGITEGFFSKNTNVLDSETPLMAKDVTEEANETPLKSLILAYNNATLATQIEFVKLLAAHDFDKIQHALKGKA
jgi:hypothetical protein